MAQRGRPSKEEKMDVTFNLRFNSKEYKELTRIANEAGCHLSELIRETVRHYILEDE